MLRKVVRFVFQQKPQMVDEHDRPTPHNLRWQQAQHKIISSRCVCVCVLDQDVCWDHVNVLFIFIHSESQKNKVPNSPST